MGQPTHDEDDLRLYLLGLLPQERQPALEERLLTDSEFYEELLITEEELIDEYLAGGLAERERAVFAERFANTACGQREVRFAGALRAYVAANTSAAVEVPAEPSAESPAPSAERAGAPAARGGGFFARLRALSPVPAFSLAAAALILVAAVSWLAVNGLRPTEPREVVTVLLTPGGVTRGGDGDGVQQVVVPAGADEVRLRLRLTADDFRSYRATLHRADGTEAATAEGLKPEATADSESVVVMNVPARAAPPGDYHLRLRGVNASGDLESADSYRFRVISR